MCLVTIPVDLWKKSYKQAQIKYINLQKKWSKGVDVTDITLDAIEVIH